MTLEPILTASPQIQIHVVAALVSIILGPFALLRVSRDKWHKRAGYVWVIAMLTTAISSFFILEGRLIGPFSPIHGLSIFTLWSLWQAIRLVRAGNIAAHRATMRSLYFWAMGVAGMFTFLPGRRMNSMLFGDTPEIGFGIAVVLIGGGLGFYLWRGWRVAARA